MKCPLCNSDNTKNFNIKTQEESRQERKMTICHCRHCQLTFAKDYEKDRSDIYQNEYATWDTTKEDNSEQNLVAKVKKNSFKKLLKGTQKYINPDKKKILDIGAGPGYLLEAASDMGFECYGLDVSASSTAAASLNFPGRILQGTLLDANYPDDYFDLVTMTDVLEHLNNPLAEIKEINRILKLGGYLLITAPNHNSVTRYLLGKNWFQYKYEHVLYFNKPSLRYFLSKNGFQLTNFTTNKKYFSLAYYFLYFQKYSLLGLGKLFVSAFPILPKWLKNLTFYNILAGEFLAIARKKHPAKKLI